MEGRHACCRTTATRPGSASCSSRTTPASSRRSPPATRRRSCGPWRARRSRGSSRADTRVASSGDELRSHPGTAPGPAGARVRRPPDRKPRGAPGVACRAGGHRHGPGKVPFRLCEGPRALRAFTGLARHDPGRHQVRRARLQGGRRQHPREYGMDRLVRRAPRGPHLGRGDAPPATHAAGPRSRPSLRGAHPRHPRDPSRVALPARACLPRLGSRRAAGCGAGAPAQERGHGRCRRRDLYRRTGGGW